MPEPRRPALFSIAAHRAFADSLVAGIRATHGRGGAPDALARGLLLLPNNRAVRAVRDAFVRASGGGLLLPRLVPIGDIDLGERIGGALDGMALGHGIPPAIQPMQRHMILARLIQTARARAGEPIDAGEALRLAIALGGALDQLQVERRTARDVAALEVAQALSSHWQAALSTLSLLLEQWPAELARLGVIDAADRRNRLFDAIAAHWRAAPPQGFVIAAGIMMTAPAVASLLRVVGELPRGQVVFPDLDQNLSVDQWDAIAPLDPGPDASPRERAAESHPQYALKLLLDRMGVHRAEVAEWRWGSEHDGRAARGRAITLAMLPARLTGVWQGLKPGERVLTGVRALEAETPAEEAQAIAIAMREALETPGRTAALVTPDRALATRVAAHLGRWGVRVDDSAGRPLAQLAPGSLLAAIAEAATSRFAPVPLLALLKHPLVRAGDARLGWLDAVRSLDLLLRGPRPRAGLAGIGARLAEPPKRQAALASSLLDWWAGVRPILEPLEAGFAREAPIAELAALVRDAASALTDEVVWAGHQGHAAAALMEALEEAAPHGPPTTDGAGFTALFAQLLAAESVRPPQGGHPRLQILGLIEARLQQADLMILGGLSEGVWPGLPSPDPWLAPRVRLALGLPGLDRRIGLAAHDFANGLGAPEVLITRAKRDASAPTIASRFWLRLKALAGPKWVEDARLLGLARAIDKAGGDIAPAPRPAPAPPLAARPRAVSVTDVDRLNADPYAFYARKILGLTPLDPVDADPSAAWRGTAVHDVLERWLKEDGADPAALLPRARRMLADADAHPVMRALWQPRLLGALEWIAAAVAGQRAAGRSVLLGEERGVAEIAGIRLSGVADRIDRTGDGALVIVDYKTGTPPSIREVRAGYALQLGLVGLIAREGGFADIRAGVPVGGFEYWGLGRNTQGGFGKIASPTEPLGKGQRIVTSAFVDLSESHFRAAAARYLTGTDRFEARRHPDAPVFSDYDQLMRLDEWFGRGTVSDG